LRYYMYWPFGIFISFYNFILDVKFHGPLNSFHGPKFFGLLPAAPPKYGMAPIENHWVIPSAAPHNHYTHSDFELPTWNQPTGSTLRLRRKDNQLMLLLWDRYETHSP
jgi:hypothetical protein